MACFKYCALSLTVSHLLLYITNVASKKLSDEEKAFILAENECDKIVSDMTGAPILLTAAHLVLVAKTLKMTNHSGGKYSMELLPRCIQKGDTDEKTIVVTNLGKTKCGSSNVEVGANYLFFLRNTPDPSIFYTLNAGAKLINSKMLWTDVFPMFCAIKKKLVCKRGVCPEACEYNVLPPSNCISTKHVVDDEFKSAYPNGPPTTTSTTPVTSTTKVTTPVPVTTPAAEATTPTTTSPDQMTSTSPSQMTSTSLNQMTSTSLNQITPKPPASDQGTTTSMPNESTDEMTSGTNTPLNETHVTGKVVTYAPVNNSTPQVQHTKRNPNGQESLRCNQFILLAVMLVSFLFMP